MARLNDKVVVITGAASGFGRSAALLFAQEGARVDAAVAAAVENDGQLDIMFNNAGISRGGKLIDAFTEADLDACFNVNTKGASQANLTRCADCSTVRIQPGDPNDRRLGCGRTGAGGRDLLLKIICSG